jgi:hypothetical protein
MRFVEEDDQIVDSLTGLIWQRSYKSDLTIREALKYADQLSKETGREWRLPTIEELSSLIDRSRANPASEFPDMPTYEFWSSSPYVGYTYSNWFVKFFTGGVDCDFHNHGMAVRLVRSR